ncbi:trypsin-1-like [Carassius gibelio]|uniref:trypsin-1-like n=1 Tax=Carassius gibelio TaxID=101364 RepID=UPI00227813DE|nr:trypsin-1-like [Carassius gibelio]
MKFNSALSFSVITLLYITGSLSQLDVCGRAPLSNRIVGGEDATTGAWPWQVSIHLTGSGHFCGGTLINKDWVLTAAHCFHKDDHIKMYFGRLNQSGSNTYEMSRTASQIINHPNYTYIYMLKIDNDIALVQLSSSVTFSDYIKPVCLAAAGSVFGGGTKSWVTGWGTLQSGGTQIPNTLQQVMVPVVNNRACDNAYGGVFKITSNMICAGLLNQGGKDSCLIDSGGPMVSKNGSLWIQSGVVSFGRGCADPKYPGVYSRVSEYQDWIKSYTGSNPPGFVNFNSTASSNLRSVPSWYIAMFVIHPLSLFFY